MNEEMVKNASFTDEVVRLARSGTSGAQLAQQLDDYHEKDIAAALEQLDQQHRLLVYQHRPSKKQRTVRNSKIPWKKSASR